MTPVMPVMPEMNGGAAAQPIRLARPGTTTTYTALGLRFWDPATDAAITDGLRVTALPLPALRPASRAERGRSGLFAFHHLPGLLDLQRSRRQDEDEPPAARDFVIQVADSSRRFLPLAFRVTLPLAQPGVFRPPFSLGPGDAGPALDLHTAPGRRSAPWLSVVRGELVDRATGAPCAHAVLRLEVDEVAEGDQSIRGVADTGGRFQLAFPRPTPATNGGMEDDPPLDQTWALRLRVHRQPSRLDPLPGTDVAGGLPDAAEVYRQAAAQVFQQDPEEGGVAGPEWTGELAVGRETAVFTEGLSRLLVDPAPG